MSYGNSSRNIANLLKYEAQQHPKINSPTKVPAINNQIELLSIKNPRPLLPINNTALQIDTNDDILQIEHKTDKKPFRLRSSRKTNDTQMNNSFDLSRYSAKDQNQLQRLGTRLQQIVQFYDNRHNNLEKNLLDRLNGLQNLVMKEVPKIDNTSMLKTDIFQFKQNIRELRQKQQLYSEQLQSIKGKIKNKSLYKQKSVNIDPKQKQKMTVLFMEVVRVSDALQSIQKGVSNTGHNYEARLQQLEYKLKNSEKNVAILLQKNNSSSQIVTDLGDKVIDRLQSAQNNLLILGKERVKDRQTINQLLGQNQRVGKDMESLLRNLQGDYQNKLQTRISDTVSRLMNEHESRVSAQEQIRRNLDMREKIIQQKHNQDKIQTKARYDNMDALVRQQFHKKQEGIKMVRNLLQNQVKNMQKLFSTQAQNRKQQQNGFKNQIKRLQDNFRAQYDIFKTHQSDVLQKIGDLVKQQVQMRVNSEVNLKKLTSQIASQIINDLTSVKQSSENSNKNIHLKLKEVTADSSEKFGQLSHYIDDEVKKVSDTVSQKYNKMKTVFTKIAQQLKQHLTNTQNNRKSVEKRLIKLEDNFDKLKIQMSAEIDQFYADLDARLKQEKQYVETFTFRKNNDLSIRITKLEEQSSQNLNLIKGGIQQNNKILTKRSVQSRQSKSGDSEQQMKQLRTIVFNIKNLTQQLKQDHIDSYQKFRRQIRLRETQSRQNNYDKQSRVIQKLDKNSGQIQQLQYKNEQLSNKVNSIMVDGDSNGIMSSQKLKRVSDELDELSRRVREMERNYAEKQVDDKEMKKVLVELKQRV